MTSDIPQEIVVETDLSFGEYTFKELLGIAFGDPKATLVLRPSNEDTEVSVAFHRMETPEEVTARLKQAETIRKNEEARKSYIEKVEKSEYERLKKKFG